MRMKGLVFMFIINPLFDPLEYFVLISIPISSDVFFENLQPSCLPFNVIVSSMYISTLPDIRIELKNTSK